MGEHSEMRFAAVAFVLCVCVVPSVVAHIGFGRNLYKRFRGQSNRIGSGHHTTQTTSVTHFFDNAILDHFGTQGTIQSCPETIQEGAQRCVDGQLRWSQRYHVNATFWKGDGYPIFLLIGGEGPQTPVTDRLMMYHWAEKHHALMFALEHRFYGESFPTADMSTDNLRYLTSHQALADLAAFIEYIKEYSPQVPDSQSTPPLSLPNPTRNSPWIVFGGSYPGNLANWFKLRYSHLTVGSVASSAPVHAEADFEAYAGNVGTALNYTLIGGSAECYRVVQEATAAIHKIVSTHKTVSEIRSLLPEALVPCSNMSSILDLATYESELFGNFQGVVQYNQERAETVTLGNLCTELTAKGVSPVEAFARATALVTEGSCIQSSFQKDVVDELSNITFSGPGCDRECSSSRQWVWQTCNEFGYFQTTTHRRVQHPFSAFTALNLTTAGTEICAQVYKLKPALPPTVMTNTLSGSRRVSGINITLVNGNMDPWHTLSVVNKTDPFYNFCMDTATCIPQRTEVTVNVVLIDGTAHCHDMHANAEGDPEPLVFARQVIGQHISQWLGKEVGPPFVPSDHDGSHKLSTAAVVGIAVAVTVVSLGLVFVVIQFARSRRPARKGTALLS